MGLYKQVYPYGRYYPVSEHKHLLGCAGIEVPNGCIVHHKDFNPRNNSLDNLEVITRIEHAERHRNDVAKVFIGKRPLRDYCDRGHAQSKDNIYIRPDGIGRECLTCRRQRMRDRPSRAICRELGIPR